MGIIHIVTAAIIITVLSIILKEMRKEIAIMVSIMGGLFIFLIIIPYLREVVNFLNDLSSGINTNLDHITIILRILGVAYIAEFGSQICKDAGEGAISSKIELAGKVIIMVMAVPIIGSFLNIIVGILP